ncbi:2'-5' RNA ligase family protein [Actinoplanes aureus]|uniref:2'-5' RNA ligase family protein n=1 Tax=Actinoplanes aureus TaxID=2792083 RepID=A0A931G1F1_9ACTN|nr:2'-5' RNA ligase family protein [Actinoplanes aureus]MBG0565081.1 2'-5' RNA ligase family protein [Actinoplanes aureus]
MHTVELLFDAALETSVRDLWQRLHAAGLRSLAAHTHATNRPHLTLVTTGRLPALPPLGLPVPVSLGPAALLGRTLVREVTAGPSLRRLQSAVWGAVVPANPLHSPDRWTPHVSLALNLPAAQHAAALELLRELPPAHGELVTGRSYDTESRTVTDL